MGDLPNQQESSAGKSKGCTRNRLDICWPVPPPKEPIKRGRFLAERQSWHDWRNDLDVYSAEDSQAKSYSYLRGKVDLGAEDYDTVIGNSIQHWQLNARIHTLAA